MCAPRREREAGGRREQPHPHLLMFAIFRWPELADEPELLGAVPYCKHPYRHAAAQPGTSAVGDPLLCTHLTSYLTYCSQIIVTNNK